MLDQTVIIGLLGISFFLAFLSFSLDKEHMILRFMFLFSSFLFSGLAIRFIGVLIENSTLTYADKLLPLTDFAFILFCIIASVVFLYLLYYIVKVGIQPFRDKWDKLSRNR